jgi:hypothetical protein
MIAPGGSINGLGATNNQFTQDVVNTGNQLQQQEAQHTIDAMYRQAERNRLNRLFDETLQHVQDKFTQHKNAVNNLGGAAGA